MEALSALTRKDLQSLAKGLRIKATGTNDALRKSIVAAQARAEGSRRKPLTPRSDNTGSFAEKNKRKEEKRKIRVARTSQRTCASVSGSADSDIEDSNGAKQGEAFTSSLVSSDSDSDDEGMSLEARVQHGRDNIDEIDVNDTGNDTDDFVGDDSIAGGADEPEGTGAACNPPKPPPHKQPVSAPLLPDRVRAPQRAHSLNATQVQKLEQEYIRALESDVARRKFPLESTPTHQCVATGRTIKVTRGWTGTWPAIREFMQNTIDHLQLLDPNTGRRNAAVNLRVTPPPIGWRFEFTCSGQPVCTIEAKRNEVSIEQHYTYPINPRALDTGVIDLGKKGADSAGGFGDGFKTGAVALLALPGHRFGSLSWYFEADGHEIVWNFSGASRQAVGTYAASKVLEVEICRKPKLHNTKQNWMLQKICVKNIGDDFIKMAVPRLCIFWNISPATEAKLLSVPSVDYRGTRKRGGGGDFLANAKDLPKLDCGAECEPGVYVRGIWVCKPRIQGTIMAFFKGSKLDVSGRDRNDIDPDDLARAVMWLFQRCDRAHLCELLHCLRSERRPAAADWLLRRPASLLNRLLEENRDFFVHDVFGYPRGTLFVSKRTLESKNPFVKWAADFLRAHDAPLAPLEKGACRQLFTEVSEWELKEQCVKQLRTCKNLAPECKKLEKMVRKILAAMYQRSAIIRFSPLCAVVFVHKKTIFLPSQPLTRNLAFKIMTLVQSEFEQYQGQAAAFSALMQAMCESTPTQGVLHEAHVDQALKRAEQVKKMNDQFAVTADKPKSSQGGHVGTLGDSGGLFADLEDVQNNTASDQSRSRKRNHDSTFTFADDDNDDAELEADIQKAKRQRSRGDDIPAQLAAANMGGTAIDQDDREECCRHSELHRTSVSESLGGGDMLCDRVASQSMEQLPASVKIRIKALRGVVALAIAKIRQAVPNLNGMPLECIRDGFDHAGYYGFCQTSGTPLIVINIRAFLPRLKVAGRRGSPALLFDVIETLTHELAHLTAGDTGHGLNWRARHMQLMKKVYAGRFIAPSHCSCSSKPCVMKPARQQDISKNLKLQWRN